MVSVIWGCSYHTDLCSSVLISYLMLWKGAEASWSTADWAGGLSGRELHLLIATVQTLAPSKMAALVFRMFWRRFYRWIMSHGIDCVWGLQKEPVVNVSCCAATWWNRKSDNREFKFHRTPLNQTPLWASRRCLWLNALRKDQVS